MTAPAIVDETGHIERFRRLARDAQQEYTALLRMAVGAIAAADRREIVALVMALEACDNKQRAVDPIIRELTAVRNAIRAGDPDDRANRLVEEIIGPVSALGAQVMASYAQLRDRTTLGRTEIGRELDQLRHADTVRSAYQPPVGGRNLNLVR